MDFREKKLRRANKATTRALKSNAGIQARLDELGVLYADIADDTIGSVVAGNAMFEPLSWAGGILDMSMRVSILSKNSKIVGAAVYATLSSVIAQRISLVLGGGRYIGGTWTIPAHEQELLLVVIKPFLLSPELHNRINQVLSFRWTKPIRGKKHDELIEKYKRQLNREEQLYQAHRRNKKRLTNVTR